MPSSRLESSATAAEQYVAAHFGSQLTSDEFWNTQAPQIEPFLGYETNGGGDRRALSGGLSRRARSCLRHRRAADSRVGSRERKLGRKRPRRWRGAPGLYRQRVRIHPGVALDRVRSDIGAGRAGRSGHAGSPACGGEARWPRDWPGAIGDPVPGRMVAGARVDRLCRSPDVRRAACVSGRGSSSSAVSCSS